VSDVNQGTTEHHLSFFTFHPACQHCMNLFRIT